MPRYRIADVTSFLSRRFPSVASRYRKLAAGLLLLFFPRVHSKSTVNWIMTSTVVSMDEADFNLTKYTTKSPISSRIHIEKKQFPRKGSAAAISSRIDIHQNHVERWFQRMQEFQVGKVLRIQRIQEVS
jgi:hypothetical protein